MLAADPPLDLTGREPVSLSEVVDGAAQLTRVDRKYLVGASTAQALIDALAASYRVLAIDGRRVTSYRSTYFDTHDLATARAHVQQRRRRWKARSRMYVEDGLCRIEVKAKDGRGTTVKSVANSVADAYARLAGSEAAFVRDSLAAHDISVDVSLLAPTMEVTYRRATLARTETTPSRVTFDWGVRCRLDGQEVRLDDGHVLVETKGGPRPGLADRLLIGLGVRPASFSKYASAAALLRDDIPDNDVRRLRRVLHTDLGVTA